MSAVQRTQKLRLHQVEPDQLALEIAGRFLGHVLSQAHALGLGAVSLRFQDMRIDLDRDTLLRSLPLYRAVRELALYAQGRLELNSEAVGERLETLLPLWQAAIGTSEAAEVPAEPSDALSLVILGAGARERLALGESLSAAQLAVLAGRDRDNVLERAAAGAIQGGYRRGPGLKAPWAFPAKAAAKWLQQLCSETCPH